MRSVRFILILGGLISFSFLTETWYVLDSTEFGFSMLFPMKPTEQKQVVESAVGELKLNMYIYDASTIEEEDNLVYLVNYTEYPDSVFANAKEEQLTQVFRNSVDGMMSNVNGTILSEKVIALNGFPGRDVKASIQDGSAIVNARIYLVKNKMYMLETVSLATKDPNPSTTKFFDSFKFK